MTRVEKKLKLQMKVYHTKRQKTSDIFLTSIREQTPKNV